MPVGVRIFLCHKREFYTSFKSRPRCSVCIAGWCVCQVSDNLQVLLTPGLSALSLPCNVLLEKIRTEDFPVGILLIACVWQRVPLFRISYNLVVRQSYTLWYGSRVWLLCTWNGKFELKFSLNQDVRLHLWLPFLLDSADLETWSHLGWNFRLRLFHRPVVCSRRTDVWLPLCDLSSHWQSRSRCVHLQNSDGLALPLFLH